MTVFIWFAPSALRQRSHFGRLVECDAGDFVHRLIGAHLEFAPLLRVLLLALALYFGRPPLPLGADARGIILGV